MPDGPALNTENAHGMSIPRPKVGDDSTVKTHHTHRTLATRPLHRAARHRTGASIFISAPQQEFMTGLATLWDFHALLAPRVVRYRLGQTSGDEPMARAWIAVGDTLRDILPPEDVSTS